MRPGARGVATIAVLLILAIVAVIGLAAIGLSADHLQVSMSQVHSERAHYAAEGGLTLALNELSKAPPPLPPEVVAGSLPNNPTGDGFEVSVYDNSAGTTPLSVPELDFPIPKGTLYVQSYGIARSESGRELARRRVGTLIQRLNGDFRVGALADSFHMFVPAVGLDPPTIDAYDSGAGPYGPATLVAGADVVATNRNTNPFPFKAITNLMGEIRGNVRVGPGGGSELLWDPGGVQGSISTLPKPMPCPTFTVPTLPPQTFPWSGPLDIGGSHTLPPGAYGDLSVIAGRIDLQPGEYVFDSLYLAAGDIGFNDPSGSVVIYVRNSLNLVASDTILNSTRDPKKFKICYDGTAPVGLYGGSESYCTVIAPRANVTVTGSLTKGLFGAVATNHKLTLSGAGFHFDTSLLGVGAQSGPAHIEVLGHQRF